jgi:hypothetical protein
VCQSAIIYPSLLSAADEAHCTRRNLPPPPLRSCRAAVINLIAAGVVKWQPLPSPRGFISADTRPTVCCRIVECLQREPS